ncbi:MAG: hypothetical protein JWO15_2825 [Sphingomonadales bacterium]|nr:hypothetical protein [Sphingomonadales bacterium]
MASTSPKSRAPMTRKMIDFALLKAGNQQSWNGNYNRDAVMPGRKQHEYGARHAQLPCPCYRPNPCSE